MTSLFRLFSITMHVEDIPLPALELLVLCLVESAFDPEVAAAAFRVSLAGEDAAAAFTGDAVDAPSCS